MNYGVLLWPHANARYQAEAVRLARAELEWMLLHLIPESTMIQTNQQEFDLLEFTVPSALNAQQITQISRHSHLYVLFQIDGESYRPISGRAATYLQPDLPGVLKYKGKTNETFTAFTMNLALYASAFWEHSEEKLRFADPMCSRGTSLFQAVNRGWDAYGTDLNATDLKELSQYFKRYLEFHKMKHSFERESFTIPGAKGIPALSFAFSNSQESYKAGDQHILRAAECDCSYIGSLARRAKYHVMACDLPYGVQHAPGGASLDRLLTKSLPAWRDALLPGGAIALSFNSNIIKLETIRKLMEDSGLIAMRSGIWDELSHWVEQAVERDVAIGVRLGAS